MRHNPNPDIEQTRELVRSLAQSCALVVQRVADLANHVEPPDGVRPSCLEHGQTEESGDDDGTRWRDLLAMIRDELKHQPLKGSG